MTHSGADLWLGDDCFLEDGNLDIDVDHQRYEALGYNTGGALLENFLGELQGNAGLFLLRLLLADRMQIPEDELGFDDEEEEEDKTDMDYEADHMEEDGNHWSLVRFWL